MFILSYLVEYDETLHTDLDSGKEAWCAGTVPTVSDGYCGDERRRPWRGTYLDSS
jgi:hypothetical protein